MIANILLKEIIIIKAKNNYNNINKNQITIKMTNNKDQLDIDNILT